MTPQRLLAFHAILVVVLVQVQVLISVQLARIIWFSVQVQELAVVAQELTSIRALTRVSLAILLVQNAQALPLPAVLLV